jgi:hypothetical protein
MAGSFRAFFSLTGDDSGDAEITGFSVSLIGKFELILAEWHQPPEYFLDNWTDEQFEAFWRARNQRIVATDKAIADARKPDGTSPQPQSANRRMSSQELFTMMGIKPQGSA